MLASMPTNEKIRVAFYEGGLTDNEPASVELSWPELVEALTTFDAPRCAAPGFKSALPECAGRKCPAKDGPAWSPVDIEGPRANANVRAVTAAVFDLDHVPSLDPILAATDGFARVIYSTHSHAADDLCYRLVMPLSRPVLPSEWPGVRAAIVSALDLPADPITKDLSRLYFLPCTRDGAQAYQRADDGDSLDVGEALQLAGARPALAAPTPDAGPVDLAAMRERLSDVRRSKARGDDRCKEQAAILGAVLDGTALAASGARDQTLLRACGLLAYWLPSDLPWEAALELLRPCVVAMDTQPEGLDAWLELARQKYARQSAARAVIDAQRAADEAATKELVRSVAERSAPSPEEVANWEDLVILDQREGIKICEYNARLLLACSAETKGSFRWNQVARRVEVRGGPFAGASEEVLDTVVAGWLQRNCKFYGGASLIRAAILQVAHESPYDPIAEYLGELAWDGEPRLDAFLERYLGVAGNLVYARAVSRRWLISLVARGLQPGCKVDTVLVLEGPQGARKSSALEALVSPAYFLDTSLELGSKDTMQAIAGAWLVELGELASFRRAEAERVKQFLTSKADKFRPPYGHVTVESPRRCVFVGTTNEDDYLQDQTGNRRYLPVRVGAIDVPGISRDRDLILAEAVAAFRSGERWWLLDEEVELAAEETEGRLPTSGFEEAIERWWYGEPPARRPVVFSMLDVAEQALKISSDRLDRATVTAIGISMRRSGFAYRQQRIGGKKIRRYEPSLEQLEAPQRKSSRVTGALALVSAQ